MDIGGFAAIAILVGLFLFFTSPGEKRRREARNLRRKAVRSTAEIMAHRSDHLDFNELSPNWPTESQYRDMVGKPIGPITMASRPPSGIYAWTAYRFYDEKLKKCVIGGILHQDPSISQLKIGDKLPIWYIPGDIEHRSSVDYSNIPLRQVEFRMGELE